MADDESDQQEGEAPKKGGAMKWIIIGVLVVALGAGGWFAYSTFMVEEEEAELAEGEEAEPEVSDSPALFAPLLPPLVVNFTDEYGDAHFMQVTLEVMARDQMIIDHVKNHAAVIRNEMILSFSNVNYESVITREGKQELLDNALVQIQDIIETETGETGVEAVYFTGLIIQ